MTEECPACNKVHYETIDLDETTHQLMLQHGWIEWVEAEQAFYLTETGSQMLNKYVDSVLGTQDDLL